MLMHLNADIHIHRCIGAIKNGEFEEARGLVILNNARAERVHYSESPTRVPLQIPIMHS